MENAGKRVKWSVTGRQGNQGKRSIQKVKSKIKQEKLVKKRNGKLQLGWHTRGNEPVFVLRS